MTWKEINKLDDSSIADFVAVQKSCSDYYQKSMSAVESKDKLTKATQGEMRAFVYRDPDYDLNLCVTLDNPTTIRLRVVGVGKVLDIPTAVMIMLSQIKQVARDYRASNVFAVWGDDVYPLVLEFYLAMAAAFDVNGFTNTKLMQPREHIYNLITEIW